MRLFDIYAGSVFVQCLPFATREAAQSYASGAFRQGNVVDAARNPLRRTPAVPETRLVAQQHLTLEDEANALRPTVWLQGLLVSLTDALDAVRKALPAEVAKAEAAVARIRKSVEAELAVRGEVAHA